MGEMGDTRVMTTADGQPAPRQHKQRKNQIFSPSFLVWFLVLLVQTRGEQVGFSKLPPGRQLYSSIVVARGRVK